MLSPYQFASNKPIRYIDLDGLEALDMDASDPNVQLMYTWAKEEGRGGTLLNNYYYNNYKAAQAAAFATGAAVTLDVVLFRGQVSRFLFLYVPAGALMEHNTATTPEGKEAQRQRENQNLSMVIVGVACEVGGASLSSSKFTITPEMNMSQKMVDRQSLAEAWGQETGYINFQRAVFTNKLQPGQQLVQYRVLGAKGEFGNYYAPVGTSPEQIGLRSQDVIQTYTVTVQRETKVLQSTHIENQSPYYDLNGTAVEGGGTQYFSTELKNNATFTPAPNPVVPAVAPAPVENNVPVPN